MFDCVASPLHSGGVTPCSDNASKALHRKKITTENPESTYESACPYGCSSSIESVHLKNMLGKYRHAGTGQAVQYSILV